MVPLPDACQAGRCATAYTGWWKRCGSDDFVQQIDSSPGVARAFSKFAKMCSQQQQQKHKGSGGGGGGGH